MYTIGEISKIVDISANALRYYDEIGLLKPIIVDENLYRYYSEEQIKELNYIIELKQYGFTLSEIKKVIGNRKDKSIRIMLEQKYNELQTKLNMLRKSSELLKKEYLKLLKRKVLIWIKRGFL